MKKYYHQISAESSPWTFKFRIKLFFWAIAWFTCCYWTPKPFNRWRLLVLKMFGATIVGIPFVHQRARIQIPWNINLFDKACVGDRANLYSLDKITIESNAVIAQEAYLCTGTHDFTRKERNLITSPIIIKAYSFVGARAFILPGIVVGQGAIVGACSVVTKSVASNTIVRGNPAKP